MVACRWSAACRWTATRTIPNVFAHTKQSLDHICGWHGVNRVAVAAGVREPELLTVNQNRHKVSTTFAGMDVPEQDRQMFFAHMGHSQLINEAIIKPIWFMKNLQGSVDIYSRLKILHVCELFYF